MLLVLVLPLARPATIKAAALFNNELPRTDLELFECMCSLVQFFSSILIFMRKVKAFSSSQQLAVFKIASGLYFLALLLAAPVPAADAGTGGYSDSK